MQFLQPAGWPRPRGYSCGTVASGRMVHIAGQVGRDPQTGRYEHPGFAGQVRGAIANALAILKEAGGKPEHIAEMTWYVLDLKDYGAAGADIGAAYKELIGRHFPAMTMVQVTGLLDPEAKVEIRATAVIPD
ncbi:MAG: RidA family protein [Alphaproteobacteria bacterium]|nr:RidA family protein [Alphaproteobacteria bacterium]